MTKQYEYKYNILSKLNDLPVKHNKKAKAILPLALKISKRTFELYCYIKKGERNNISPDKLQIIADYLKCTVDDLLNEEVPYIDYDLLLQENEKNQ